MSEKQRDLFSKSMVDLADIVVGALGFGQFISGQAVNYDLVVLGALMWFIFYVEAFSFSKEWVSNNG
jgi:ABC-type proline/glycine betaine transport system permease subunit